MLELDALTLTHPGFTLTADFALKSGSRTAIIGPSGAGKSTLLMSIAGFQTPTNGRILSDDTDITNAPPSKRPFAVIFQDNNLFPHLTALQNAGLGLKADLRLTSQDRVKIESTLEKLGLGGLSNRRPGELSGGQQSRLTLARALLQARPWMLLDEPFAALGPGQRREMLTLVTQLCGETGAGLLMVTHAPEDALTACPETILVADGRAHPPQATNALFDDPPAALAQYL